ncbi:putative tRNA sulfurtransferase [Spirochaetia bacterium]|nr:putative tRNA sulfurtransferase [Spirochaetia bacterium]
MNTWLLKLGELTLKGGNRKTFESVLKRNLLRMLDRPSATNENAAPPDVQAADKAAPVKARVETRNGRFYVHCDDEYAVEQALSHLMGISGWAKTRGLEKTVEAVMAACIEEGKKLRERGISTFKIEARRTDKSFPLDSWGLRSQCGQAVLDAISGLTVDVHKPGGIIQIEIREKAYVYSNAQKGLGGLPVGTAGRGLLLLSGGIDSPVAGFLMANRGMGIDAVHFHAYPYTSLEARQKVIDLAKIVGDYCLGIRLYIIGFTRVQMRIKERSPLPWSTVLLRMAMMECAEKLALKIKSKCLISGESLSQVASQTVENLSCTQSRIKLPVLRPLIGIGKESIIRKAETIGTYETSIQPYEDCCVLFSPPHPVLRGDVSEANALYESLELGPLIDEALGEGESVRC